MKEVWDSVADDIYRSDAELPSHATPLPPPQPPRVDVSGQATTVRVPVRNGVSLAALEEALIGVHQRAQTARQQLRSGISFSSSRTMVCYGLAVNCPRDTLQWSRL